jgi:hypothetical protein
MIAKKSPFESGKVANRPHCRPIGTTKTARLPASVGRLDRCFKAELTAAGFSLTGQRHI